MFEGHRDTLWLYAKVHVTITTFAPSVGNTGLSIMWLLFVEDLMQLIICVGVIFLWVRNGGWELKEEMIVVAFAYQTLFLSTLLYSFKHSFTFIALFLVCFSFLFF